MGEFRDGVAVAGWSVLEGAADLDSGDEGPPLVKVLLGEEHLVEGGEGDLLGVLFLLDHVVEVHLVEL